MVGALMIWPIQGWATGQGMVKFLTSLPKHKAVL